jgi:hypothetical protein
MSTERPGEHNEPADPKLCPKHLKGQKISMILRQSSSDADYPLVPINNQGDIAAGDPKGTQQCPSHNSEAYIVPVFNRLFLPIFTPGLRTLSSYNGE